MTQWPKPPGADDDPDNVLPVPLVPDPEPPEVWKPYAGHRAGDITPLLPPKPRTSWGGVLVPAVLGAVFLVHAVSGIGVLTRQQILGSIAGALVLAGWAAFQARPYVKWQKERRRVERGSDRP
ncbi:hypothetical protein [Mariniluteicoccus flavus]